MSPSEVAAGWRLEAGFYRESRLEALGIPHGVTTRIFGNMKRPEVRAAALAKAGLAGRRARTLKQLHGTVVLEARSDDATIPEGDGWIVADPGSVACVYAADCLPIFLWEKHGSVVGAFHAGWRGLAAGMIDAAVKAFSRHRVGPERLCAAVGPHIGACCYKVGTEVAGRFRKDILHGENLDLGEEARLQLGEAGVVPVAVSDACTSCRNEELFSFRREKMDQRMMAFIALKGEA